MSARSRSDHATAARGGRARWSGIAAAVALAAVAATAGWGWWTRDRAADGPIVLISIDTLRADHLPAYGYSNVPTPALDALARDGVLFERAYSHSPQTLPAHTSILSGRLPFEHGVRDNIGFAVKPGERLLPGMLRERGYATAGVVSAYVLRKDVGLDQGFDMYDSALAIQSPELSVGQVQRDGAESLAIAEQWIGRRQDPRWFLFLHLYEPHKPYAPPARFARYAPYDGEIAYADELVGRLVADLKARGLYDRATIVLLADHGEGLGDHGELEHGVFLYNETTHVPLIVKRPGQKAGGRRVAAAVQHIDVLPTILDGLGLPVPSDLQGRSLVPLMDGTGPVRDTGIYAEALYPRYHFGWSELTSITANDYRYIKAPREELYQLTADPGERTNLAAEQPQVASGFRAGLERLIAGRAIDMPSAVSDEDRRRLAALGYVSVTAAVPAGDGLQLADPKDKIGTLRLYRETVDLMGERRFGEAIAGFRTILADNPAMKDVWHQLANASIRAGDLAAAIDAYERLVALDATDARALSGLAAVYLRQRDLDKAQAHAELAAKFATEDRRLEGGAYELLAKVALARRAPADARRYAELAEKADPTLPMASYVQGLLDHAAGRYEAALARFQETLRRLDETSVTLTEVHYYTADTLARLGRNAEAEAQFREEVTLFPANLQAWAGLAMLYRSQGRDDGVERTIGSMVQNVPTAEGYGLGARLWTMFGEPARAAGLQREAATRETAGRPPR
ncbi:MAG: sulfatase-like hydrolase/transferase [Vicinamibacterales bacterium]